MPAMERRNKDNFRLHIFSISMTEEGGGMFFQNVGIYLQVHMALLHYSERLALTFSTVWD
jgi:hypothetical protein